MSPKEEEAELGIEYNQDHQVNVLPIVTEQKH